MGLAGWAHCIPHCRGRVCLERERGREGGRVGREGGEGGREEREGRGEKRKGHSYNLLLTSEIGCNFVCSAIHTGCEFQYSNTAEK